MRSELLTVKLLDVVTSGVAIGDSEIEEAVQRDSTKVTLQYATLSSTTLQNPATISPRSPTSIPKTRATLTKKPRRKGGATWAGSIARPLLCRSSKTPLLNSGLVRSVTR